MLPYYVTLLWAMLLRSQTQRSILKIKAAPMSIIDTKIKDRHPSRAMDPIIMIDRGPYGFHLLRSMEFPTTVMSLSIIEAAAASGGISMCKEGKSTPAARGIIITL